MKTLEDYQLEEKLDKQSEKDREISDRLYAEKRIQAIVDGSVKIARTIFVAVAIALLGFLGKIVIEFIKTKP